MSVIFLSASYQILSQNNATVVNRNPKNFPYKTKCTNANSIANLKSQVVNYCWERTIFVHFPSALIRHQSLFTKMKFEYLSRYRWRMHLHRTRCAKSFAVTLVKETHPLEIIFANFKSPAKVRREVMTLRGVATDKECKRLQNNQHWQDYQRPTVAYIYIYTYIYIYIYIYTKDHQRIYTGYWSCR